MVVYWILGITLIFIIVYVYEKWLNGHFKVERYTVDMPFIEEGQAPIKAVLLTDLHESEFGKENQTLVRTVENENPDIILIAGDMFVKREDFNPDGALSLLKQLVDICPVFYANGNHEKKVSCYWEGSKEKFCMYQQEVSKLGVHYLINESYDLDIKGTPIRVTGLDLPLNHFQKIWKKPTLSIGELKECIGDSVTGERYQILIAHNPQYFPLYSQWGADFVCSGHVHGGFMILPVVGGVIAPNYRLFPKYDFGKFTQGKTTMVLSRGLGVHTLKLRFFNVPEVSVISFFPKGKPQVRKEKKIHK